MKKRIFSILVISLILLGLYRQDLITRPMIEMADVYGKGYNEIDNDHVALYLQDFFINELEDKEGLSEVSFYLNIVNTTNTEMIIDNLYYYYDPEVLIEKDEYMTHYYKFALLPHESRGFSLKLTIPHPGDLMETEEQKRAFIESSMSHVDVIYSIEDKKYHYKLGNVTAYKDYIQDQYTEAVQCMFDNIASTHKEIDNLYWGLMIKNLNEEESMMIVDAYLKNDGWHTFSVDNDESYHYAKDTDNIKVSYGNISPSSLFYEHYQTVVNISTLHNSMN